MKQIKAKTDRPNTYRADIERHNKRGEVVCVFRVDLDEEETARIHALADKAGLPIDSFVRRLVCADSRIRPAFNSDKEPRVLVEDVRFSAKMSKLAMMRTERAALFYGGGMEKFVAAAIANNVTAWEDDIVVNPKTQEVIGSVEIIDCLLRNITYPLFNKHTDIFGPKLDSHAKELLANAEREFREEGDDYTQDDIINGAVAFMLDHEGFMFDFLEAAKKRRLEAEGGAR